MNSIKNFRKLTPLLACAGQPTNAQLKKIAHDKFQVVINLGIQDASYALENEEQLVEELGMQYHHIPIPFDNPQLNLLQTFLKVMDGCARKKVFVHCAANYRASTFAGLYLLANHQMQAYEMEDFINHVWRPNEAWQFFIDAAIDSIEGR